MLNGDGDGDGKRSIGTVKRATKNVYYFFATLLQNELNSDVAPFTALQQIGLNVGGKTLNIANNELFCTNVEKQVASLFIYLFIFFITVASGQLSPKKHFSRAAHLFVHFFAFVLHDYGVKLSYTFYRGIVVCVPVRFFYCCSVSPLWPLAFLIF